MTDETFKPVQVIPMDDAVNTENSDKKLEKNIMEIYTTKINSIPEAAKIDMVNHPLHYQTGKVQCINCMESVAKMYDGEFAVSVSQVIKYLYRAPTKQNFMQDLKKAQWYMNRLIKLASKTNK